MTVPRRGRALRLLALATCTGVGLAGLFIGGMVANAATPAGAVLRGQAGGAARVGSLPAAPGTGVVITDVEAGYSFGGGGNYRLNGPSTLRPGAVWVPVRVSLRNDGDNVEGSLSISVDPSQSQNDNGPSYRTTYTLNVALPAGARKAVTLYLRAADVGSGFTVTLQAGGHTVDARSVQPSVQQGGVLSVGVLSDDTATRPTLVPLKFGDTALSVAQFNDLTPLDTQPQALDNFDLIVLSDYSSDTLSAAQLQALRVWVRGGGTLLVAGGPDAQKTMGSLPPDLLAATFRTVTTASASALPELARLAGAPTTGTGRGPVEFSVAAPRPGATVILAHHGVPLAADLPLGRGHLVYSAVEPTEAPLSTWSAGAQGRFWNSVLASSLVGPRDALIQAGAQNGPTYAVYSSGSPLAGLAQDLGTTVEHGLPALQVYVFLIVLYVLVLGPGNYILLRWRRRLEWSWITVPVLAILFGAGSFGLAYARNGSDVLANVDAVVYLDPGAPVKLADSYVGLFAPFQGDYDLTASTAALAWGLGNDSPPTSGGGAQNAGGTPLGMSVDEGTPFAARLFGLQMWTQRNVGMQQQVILPGAVTGHFVVKGGVVSGEVTNTTGLTLRDCVVVGADGASAVVPLLKPGAHARIKPFNPANANIFTSSGNGTGPLANLYSNFSASGQAGRYDAVLGAVFPSGSAATAAAPLTLVGWSTKALQPLYVNGATPHRADLDLVVAPLALTLAPGRFSLAPGVLPVSAVGTSVTPSAAGPGSGLTLNMGDHVEVQLTLPAAGRRLRLQTLTLQANLNAGNSSLSPGDAALYNWRTGRWDTKDLSSGTATVGRAAAYASPDGQVLLRVQATQGDLTFNSVDQDLQIGATGQVL